MVRSREEIRAEAAKILQAEGWPEELEEAFTALIDEHPNEGPMDDLIISRLEEGANMLRIAPESNL